MAEDEGLVSEPSYAHLNRVLNVRPVAELVTLHSSCCVLFRGQATGVNHRKVYTQSSMAEMRIGRESCVRRKTKDHSEISPDEVLKINGASLTTLSHLKRMMLVRVPLLWGQAWPPVYLRFRTLVSSVGPDSTCPRLTYSSPSFKQAAALDAHAHEPVAGSEAHR